jgi:hypothetical protein
MKAPTFPLASFFLLLAACSPDPNAIPNPHDSKYRSLEVGADVCVLDTDTQLLWQVKSSYIGLNDAANTYSWFNPDEAHGELDYRGIEDGGVCIGSACDTWNYVNAVNDAGLCGYRDWRMPTKDEMFSISDLRRAENPPTMNVDFFPDAKAAEYWTGNDYSFQFDAAWTWNFQHGHDRVDWKKEAKFVRLVRGVATQLDAVKE